MYCIHYSIHFCAQCVNVFIEFTLKSSAGLLGELLYRANVLGLLVHHYHVYVNISSTIPLCFIWVMSVLREADKLVYRLTPAAQWWSVVMRTIHYCHPYWYHREWRSFLENVLFVNIQAQGPLIYSIVSVKVGSLLKVHSHYACAFAFSWHFDANAKDGLYTHSLH